TPCSQARTKPGPIKLRGKKNDARGAPRAAKTTRLTRRVRRVTECSGHPAGDLDSFELALGEKTNALAIRRPECMMRLFRAWQQLGRRPLEPVKPQPSDFSSKCHHHHAPPVR